MIASPPCFFSNLLNAANDISSIGCNIIRATMEPKFDTSIYSPASCDVPKKTSINFSPFSKSHFCTACIQNITMVLEIDASKYSSYQLVTGFREVVDKVNLFGSKDTF